MRIQGAKEDAWPSSILWPAEGRSRGGSTWAESWATFSKARLDHKKLMWDYILHLYDLYGSCMTYLYIFHDLPGSPCHLWVPVFTAWNVLEPGARLNPCHSQPSAADCAAAKWALWPATAACHSSDFVGDKSQRDIEAEVKSHFKLITCDRYDFSASFWGYYRVMCSVV